MFRPIRRVKNAIPMEETRALLINEKRAVLAVNGDDGYPFAFPIDFYYDADAEKIYFHGAKSGHKVDSLKKDDKVCFTVYGNEQIKDDWAPYLDSAVVYGRCHLMQDMAAAEEKARLFGLKYFPNAEMVEEEIRQSMKNVQMFEITIEHMSGKRIHER